MEFGDIPNSKKRGWNALTILQYLSEQQKLVFPAAARLKVKERVGDKQVWEMLVSEDNPDDVKKLKSIIKNTQRLLHDHSSYLDVLTNHLSQETLAHNLNAVRADHQWLWNRFWHHHANIRGKIFFVDLGNPSDTSCPTFVLQEGLFPADIDVNFDPNVLADFDGDIGWDEFS